MFYFLSGLGESTIQSLLIISTLSLPFLITSYLIFKTTFSLNRYLAVSTFAAFSGLTILVAVRKLVKDEKITYNLCDYDNFCLYLTISQGILQLIFGIESPTSRLVTLAIYFESRIVTCISLRNGVVASLPWNRWHSK